MLLTRLPLSYPLRGNRVRLACVRHAASVDSEPGSNSHVKSVRRRIDFRRHADGTLTRAPADLALALSYLLSASSAGRPVRLLRGFRGRTELVRLAVAPCGAWPDLLTLDGQSRPETPCGARSQNYVCLHALSSFQRTGFRKDPTATRPRCAISLTEVPT